MKITDWDSLALAFYVKYFPPEKTTRLRGEIISITQRADESLFEVWERFKDLQRECPHHGIDDWFLIQQFYNGLGNESRIILDSAASGRFMQLEGAGQQKAGNTSFLNAIMQYFTRIVLFFKGFYHSNTRYQVMNEIACGNYVCCEGFESSVDLNTCLGPRTTRRHYCYSSALPSIYKNGEGCGACFQVRCKNSDVCSLKGTRIVVTDIHTDKNNITDFVLSSSFRFIAQLGEKEKAVVEEMLNEAKKYLLKNNDINNARQITAMVVGAIRRSFGQRMRKYKEHNWIGSFMARLPEFINGGDGAVFAHKGSKGAVIYGLEQDASPRPLPWILAWSKPDTPGQPNRVYVEGGTLERILRKGWNEIEEDLDKSGTYSQNYDMSRCYNSC
ncbi:uncharacterized protein [Spinacia oleracea]|uniref:Expansin-like EG45 domain-containing protein n=1 Tax=Spinacia oleracea TaxID=3562 RepID=A0ABM3RI80_SPIOL|nr:uncharacterized protein LOC110779771 [Spinacia oleracea]